MFPRATICLIVVPKRKEKMARWFIPHLPIQATTLAIKSKTTVVEIALELHISINWTCINSSRERTPCNRRNSSMCCDIFLSTVEHVVEPGGRSFSAQSDVIGERAIGITGGPS